MNVLILLVVLVLQLEDCLVLLGLNLGNFGLPLGLHVLTQASHLSLVLLLDLVRNALEFLSFGGGQGVVVLRQSVTILGLTHLLLLLLHFECTQVLLELALIDAMLIFGVLQLDLGLLLDHRLLV